MRCALLPLQQPQQGFWHLRSMHCMVARGAAVCGVDGCYPGTIAHELTTAAVLCLLVWLTAFVFRSWVYLGYALQQPAPQALPDATRTRWRSRWSSDSRSVHVLPAFTPQGPLTPLQAKATALMQQAHHLQATRPGGHALCICTHVFGTSSTLFPRRGSARGSHTGQFSCFGPRSCFIAFVLDTPNGIWPLNRAVGRAFIRETVPVGAPFTFF
jgi:hypothetical protein